MTTNQTIDGVLVPRETLQKWLDDIGPSRHVTQYAALKREELRGLLDAEPAPCAKSQVAPVTACAIADALESSQWPNTSIGNKVLVAAAITELRKAAHPQGEPVAWLMQAIGKDGEVYRNRATTAEPTMRDIEIAWGQSVIDRFTIVIKPLYAEQPAPVAVVLPERKTITAGLLSESNTHNQGWNAFLDELKRLNPSL